MFREMRYLQLKAVSMTLGQPLTSKCGDDGARIQCSGAFAFVDQMRQDIFQSAQVCDFRANLKKGGEATWRIAERWRPSSNVKSSAISKSVKSRSCARLMKRMRSARPKG